MIPWFQWNFYIPSVRKWQKISIQLLDIQPNSQLPAHSPLSPPLPGGPPTQLAYKNLTSKGRHVFRCLWILLPCSMLCEQLRVPVTSFYLQRSPSSQVKFNSAPRQNREMFKGMPAILRSLRVAFSIMCFCSAIACLHTFCYSKNMCVITHIFQITSKVKI